MEKVDLSEALRRIDNYWHPRTVAALNDYDVKLVKVQGEFVWHHHAETDELFLVLKGKLRIRQRERDIDLAEGELYVVPRGVEHCPVAEEEAQVLLVEPRGTVNTGNLHNERTIAGMPI
jgi:mannose-6-phosphate isomerase-like protein (cupin superfamily)